MTETTKQSSKETDMSDDVEIVTDLVSVIIPAKNSAETIERCLQSVKAQTHQFIEIVVVDNHSSDDTVAIAERYADRVLISGPERSPQANIGAQAAKGEWIYIIGSDFIIDPTIIEEGVLAAHRQGVNAILTANHSDPTVSRWARARAFERSMYVGDDHNVGPRFVRRETYLAMGGFDENLIAGEDYDFYLRLKQNGDKAVWVEASELHIGEPKTISEVIRKHYFYGGDLRKYVKKHGKKTVMQLNPVRPAFLRHWKKFFKQPRDAAIFFIYWPIKYAAGGAGYVSGGRGYRWLKLYEPKAKQR